MKHKMFLALSLLLWLVGCVEDVIVDPPPPPVLEILQVPFTLLTNIDSMYVFRVQFAEEELNPPYVLCEVIRPDGSPAEEFRLYDDGSSSGLPAHPYADTLSHDVVPNNNTYTRTINGRLLSDGMSGNYDFDFSVPNTEYTNSATVPAAFVEVCVFEAVPTISAMQACFPAKILEVEVSRTEPDNIESIYLFLSRGAETIDSVMMSETISDTVWQLTLAPYTFPCSGTGDDFAFTFRATTRFGLTCESTIQSISFINDDQEILNLAGLPDTLYRPVAVGDTDTVVVTLDLDDCDLEGILTFNGVRFEINQDDEGWEPHPTFVLNDAGVAGDTIAGDGTYSVGLTFNRNDNLPDNVFIFRYFSVECAPPYEQTDYLYDTVRVIQPEPIMNAIPLPSNPRGFSVLVNSEAAGERR